MSEIQLNQPKSGKRKLLSTKVDLTPMVDLGFLLITFFVFTTSMSQSKAMQLFLPADGDSSNTPQSGALTIIADEKKAWYYQGTMEHATLAKQFLPVDYQTLRSVIIKLKYKLQSSKGNEDDLMIIIKSTPLATFGNTIDILDEMTINDIHRYALVDINPSEQRFIDSYSKK